MLIGLNQRSSRSLTNLHTGPITSSSNFSFLIADEITRNLSSIPNISPQLFRKKLICLIICFLIRAFSSFFIFSSIYSTSHFLTSSSNFLMLIISLLLLILSLSSSQLLFLLLLIPISALSFLLSELFILLLFRFSCNFSKCNLSSFSIFSISNNFLCSSAYSSYSFFTPIFSISSFSSLSFIFLNFSSNVSNVFSSISLSSLSLISTPSSFPIKDFLPTNNVSQPISPFSSFS